MFLSKDINHLKTKIPRPGMRNPLLNHLSRLFKRLLKHSSELLLLLVALEKWKVSSYCWSHNALQKEDPEAPELKLTWRTPFWGLDSKGMKLPIVLPSSDACKMNFNNSQRNTKDGLAMDIMVVTNSSVIGLKIFSTRGRLCLVKNKATYQGLEWLWILENLVLVE